jgi:hypothetical protein
MDGKKEWQIIFALLLLLSLQTLLFLFAKNNI